jgi:LCP family protein required for cell wall assembly
MSVRQPAPSPGSHPTTARFSAVDRAQRVRFRRAVALVVMTLLVPGSAQLVAGSRKVGRIAVRVWLGTIAVVVVGFAVLMVMGMVGGLLDDPTPFGPRAFALWAGTNTKLLLLVRLLLMAGAVAWAYLFVDAWRLGQPLSLQRQHRLAIVGVNGFLCFSVAGALLFGAHVAGVQRGLMISMFGDGDAVGASAGRYNVLLMGGDSGAGRWGLRPDSLTVASIDAETGKTVLISLPRNMQNFPFAEGSVMDKQFPDGFNEEGQYLNGLATWALDHSELFKGSKNPGVDATIMGVEGITGLEINYWAMVNLKGFKDLVDAFGGVELNVRQKIPVGLPHDDFFRYIPAGQRKLDGTETLWFARARYDSDDYSRMARQKCVMSAMLQQVSPQTAVTKFQKIAEASSAMVSTDIPRSEVDRFVDLALKARNQKIATISLVPPMINTAAPDIALVQSRIAEAIARAEGQKPAEEAPAAPAEEAPAPAETPAAPATDAPAPPTPTPVTGGSIGSLSQGYAANEAQDLGAVC